MFVPSDSDLEIVVSLLAEMRVELRDPREADGFVVLDEEGEELELESGVDHDRLPFTRAELVDGASEVLTVSDEAAWIVLYRGRIPVREIPVSIYADEEPVALRL